MSEKRPFLTTKTKKMMEGLKISYRIGPAKSLALLPFAGKKVRHISEEGVRASMLEMTEPKVTSINLAD